MGKKYTVKIPDGMHLASSNDTYGAKRGTLLDDNTNKIVGQAEFFECDDDYDEYDTYDDDTCDDSEGLSLGGALLATAGLAFCAAIASSARKSHEEDELENEKKRIKREIQLEEFRQKELKKAELRKKINGLLKKCFIGCCKGIWWAIKHIAIGLWYAVKYTVKYTSIALWFVMKNLVVALWWFAKKLFIGTKKFCVWSYRKIKKIIVEKKQKSTVLENANKPSAKVNSKSYPKIQVDPEQFSKDIDTAFNDFQKNMSNEKAQLHFIKILLLSNELAKEIREFLNACSTEADKSAINQSAWQNTMEKLMTEKTARYINYILESNGENIEPSIAESIAVRFGVKLWDNNEFIPISQNQINENLRIN